MVLAVVEGRHKMRAASVFLLGVVVFAAAPQTASAGNPAVSYDYVPGAYLARGDGHVGAIPVSTRIDLGDWSLRAYTRFHLAPLDPYTTAESYRADPMFGSPARVVADDTRLLIERPIMDSNATQLTLMGQLRLPTGGRYYRNLSSTLEGALGLELAHYQGDLTFWATGMQRFRGEGNGPYLRKDSWDADLSAAKRIDKNRMIGVTAQHWTSSYRGGRPGDRLGLFLRNRFIGSNKGELRAYLYRQVSPDCCYSMAALSLRLAFD